MSESIIVLEKKRGLGRQRRSHCFPVYGVREIDIEIRDHGSPIQFHIRLGWKVGLLDVLHLCDQSLLRRAPRTRIPMDRTLIHHDREREAWMCLGFRHHELGRLVDTVVGSVPVNDYAVDSPADHVCNLPVNLRRVRRTVSDVHMVRSTEPEHEVRVYLRR